MSTTYTVHIEAPVEKAFDFWKDPRNWPRMAAKPPVEVTQAHVPPEGLGTFHVATFALPGFRMEYFGVFTEFVPNERIVDKVSLALLGVSHSVVTADVGLVGTGRGMSYSTDRTEEQWALLEPVFNAPGKRGRKHAPDLRSGRRDALHVA